MLIHKVFLFFFSHWHRCLSLDGIIKMSNTHKSLFLHEKYVVGLFLLKKNQSDGNQLEQLYSQPEVKR